MAGMPCRIREFPMLRLKTSRRFALTLIVFAILLAFGRLGFAQERVDIDAHAQTTPFPHFWGKMFGSGRAILSLRESFRDDLRAVKQVADIRYVRFHAILH